MRIKITSAAEMFWLGEGKIPYNFAMMARVQGNFTPEQLSTALEMACLRHPLMSARVELDECSQGWLVSEGVPGLPVRVLDGCGELDWQGVVLDELGTPFDTKAGPLARCVMLRSPGRTDLVLTFHHYVCDGMSGAFFTRDVLRLLGEPHLLLETLHPFEGDLSDRVPAAAQSGALTRMQLWSIRQFTPLAWPVIKRLPRPRLPRTGPPPWRRFTLLTGTLSQEQTSALLERCRSESVTVNTAICAAWLLADAQAQASRGPARLLRRLLTPRPRWTRRVSIPINLRPFLPGDPSLEDRVGIFMSNMTVSVDCRPTRPFWEIAREIHQKVRRELQGDRVHLWLLRTTSAVRALRPKDRRGLFDVLSTRSPGYDLAITNLGRLDFPTHYGPLHVESLYGPLVNGFPWERTVSVLTFGGSLSYSFCFRDFVLERLTAEKIQSRAMQILEKEIEHR